MGPRGAQRRSNHLLGYDHVTRYAFGFFRGIPLLVRGFGSGGILSRFRSSSSRF